MPSLAVISDVHDNLANLSKALNYIQNNKIDYLICTGDLQTKEAWAELDKLNLPVFAVKGNADDGLDLSIFSKLKIWQVFGEIELNGKKIIFSHYPEVLKKILEQKPQYYDLALHGHSHQPWEEKFQNTKILNPGNVANIRYNPTFAIINLDNLKAQLILLNEIK
jgi:putative phosphoesterase